MVPFVLFMMLVFLVILWVLLVLVFLVYDDDPVVDTQGNLGLLEYTLGL